MKGKITLSLAISLDGYIANEDGSYEWIAGQGDCSTDTENEFPFDAFLSGIDVVVMGGRSYRQGFAKDHSSKKVYVATNNVQEDIENIHFISGGIVSPALAEREAGKNVYLFGGGITVAPFIQANAIDEYFIGIIPVILGKGIPLFLGENPTIPLTLTGYSVRDGITELHYVKREGV